MKRRDFLKLSGCFVAAASLSSFPACGDDGGSTGVFSFAEGVASGDPRAESVVLWTRVQAVSGDTGPIAVLAQVSASEDFSDIIVEQALEATSASDHTLRLLVTQLAPGTIYFYRFTAGSDKIVGRTITAPADTDETSVNLAWVSCQDYSAGSFGAYRQMLNDDIAAAPADQIQVVVHLGDFIYETIGGRFQVPLNENLDAISLMNVDGSPRVIAPFPSGGGTIDKDGTTVTYANSLDDYRHLYKEYLHEPHLQAARARWPFIQTWDDHEFTDDCWQSQANYDSTTSTEEASQQRKVAANQAWFEFIPANLSDAVGVGGVANPASDFVSADVQDTAFTAPNADNLVDEANNVAAIGSMSIYRSIRYGKLVDFIVTDLRSYRSDHSIPEELTFGQGAFFHPRTALPAEMVRVLDEGMTANGGNPPDTVQGLVNTRKDSPVGTVLGAEQKAWWKATMQASSATWRVWCNEMPMMRFMVERGPAGILIYDRVAFCDAWDDKPTERNELMTFLKDEAIDNVVVITGDIHAHFAGTLMDNYDSATPTAVATEFVAAGISSNTIFSFFENAVRGQPEVLRDLITFDDTQFGGTLRLKNNLNTLVRFGSGAAQTATATGDAAQAVAAADPNSNPHLRFADTDAQGYGLMTLSASGVETTLVTVNRPTTEMGDAGQGIRGTASFSLPAGNAGGLTGPVFTGEIPFPQS
jgi:alkaline phosphatase D